MEKEQLLFCGDIHGEFPTLVFTLTQKLKLENVKVIVLGDFGMGFDDKINFEYKKYEKRLEERNITIYAFRGNHDDPEYFKDTEKYSYPRLIFLEDHKLYNICGREIYVIGGANSVDITWRLQENMKLACRGKNRKVWWEEEDITRIPENQLPRKVDIILSHEAPLTFLPVAKRFDETPIEQYEKILDGRKYLDAVLNYITAKYWFYGHYHQSLSGTYGDLLYRCLNIMEIFEAPEIESDKIQGELKNDN